MNKLIVGLVGVLIVFSIISSIYVNYGTVEYVTDTFKSYERVVTSDTDSNGHVTIHSKYICFFENEVFENTDNLLKIYGESKLLEGQKIKGSVSGSEATIFDIAEYKLRFDINYSSDQEMGWSSNIGFLNSDYQVLPDNDYYQNLSYTIKSPISYEKLITPVNSLLHTTGLKNFADLEITSKLKTSFTSKESQSSPLIDVISEKRTDDISNYDLAVDYDVTDNISKFV